MQLQTFRVFDNSVEANLVRTKLEHEGIVCFLFDEHSVSINPLYNNMLGGIKLKVKPEDVLHAEFIISEIEKEELTKDDGTVIMCPNCSSTSVSTGYTSSKGLAGVLSMVVSAIFMIFPLSYKHVYHCRNCGNNFK